MKILYYNNCWFTNVGEAFVDIGAMQLLKTIFPGCQLINVSNMNRLYLDLICKREKIANPYMDNMGTIRMLKVYSGDYFVMPGMIASEAFLKEEVLIKEIMELANRGTKIIFLGLGQATYSEKETEGFKRFIEKIRPALIMSRDDVVYENFKDCCPAVKGIDCAFWVKDSYDPRNAARMLYIVVTYNRSPEPKELSMFDNVVRAHHMNWSFTSKNFKENLFISDTPYDYLTLYANADSVYTDLVHATIASLQYGRHVKFDRVDNRGYAIDALENIQFAHNNFMFIKEDALETQKQRIINDIKKVI